MTQALIAHREDFPERQKPIVLTKEQRLAAIVSAVVAQYNWIAYHGETFKRWDGKQ